MNNKALYVILLLAIIGVICDVGFCGESPEAGPVGRTRTVSKNDGEIESLGRFAVEQHNEKQNTLLKFVKVVEAKEQVVAGMMYYLTLEAVDGSKNKLYEAKVWVKPWMNFKQLQEFKLLNGNPSNLHVDHDH